MARSNTRFLIAARKGALRRAGTMASCSADDQGRGRERAANELDRGHAIADEQPDRSPPVEITGHGLERVEGRDQDQSRDRSMSREIGGDRSADAEADRKDAFARLGLQEVVVDHERVREQRPRARPAGARRIAAIVERDDIAMRKERMQCEGRRLGIPGVPAEANQRRRAIDRRSLSRDSHPSKAFAVGRPDLETLS